MSVTRFRSTTYWYIVCLCVWYICTTIDAYQSRGAVVAVSGQRDLKMGKKGKKHKKKETYLDDYYYDDAATTPPITGNTTVTPSNSSIAPTPFVKSKKKKGKKGKKSKKKKKSKKEDKSLSPSPSPANITPVAPMMVATTAPIAIATMVPAAANVPTVNGTAATLTPTIQSKSKKKAKKSMKGGKGKGASDVPFQQAGSQITQVPIVSAPSPTMARAKTAVASKAPSFNSSLTAATAPIGKNATTTSKAPTSSKAVVATKTPTVRAPAPIVPTTLFPSASPSPFPYEPLSASPIPTLMLETVDVSTFQLTYNISTTDKLATQQIGEAVDVSFTFLNDYLMNSLDDNNRITYDSLIGTRIAHSVDYTTIQYMAAVRFVLFDQDSATYLPATSDVDALIQMAFNPASLQILLDLLRNLPASNPYSQTTAVVYAAIEVEATSTTAIDQPPPSDNGKSVATTVGISGALLMICLCTGLVALHRWGYFTKFRRKKNKTNYHKAPTTSASRSRSIQKESNRNADNTDNVNDEDEDDDDDECASMSDCTSSVRSCPPSSSCTSSAADHDESYRSKILEDDVEIKFLYPKTDGNMNCDASVEDPLFPSSPLQADDFRKKRHNV